MMNDHNLDDLIIDTPRHKGGKAKGLLTIIALFVVVLIVAIILTKIILKDPNSQQLALDDNETEMISPELTLQDAVEDDSQDDKALSDMIQSEMEAPKAPENKAETVAEETVVVDENKPAEKLSKPTTETKPSQTVETVKPKTDTPAPKEIVKIPNETPSKPAAVSKPQPKPVPVSTSGEQFYIQVGSFTRSPGSDSRLISALKKQRFHYRIMQINHMQKVLVGPYKSRAEADRAIIRVKDLINKNAFVVKK